MKQVVFLIGAAILLIASFVALSFLFVGCAYINDASRTAFKETKASTILERYSWFKDSAARLDAYKADIDVYEGRFDRLKSAYAGQPRSKWAREDREQANLWEQEVAGIKAGYNSLASEYNSAMAKINWAYCNQGSIPAGGVPLPREFRVYEAK